MGTAFAKFVDDKVKACQDKCREDLLSTTSFVTWSLHSGNRNGLNSVLGPVGNPNPRPSDQPAARAAAAAAAPAPAEDIDDDYDAGEESYGIDYPDERGGRSTRGGGRPGSKSERPRAAVVARGQESRAVTPAAQPAADDMSSQKVITPSN